MTRKHPDLRVKILRQLRPWHRRIGILSTLLVLFMALTGVLINHSNHLSLDSAHVRQAWLLDYYGIKAPRDLVLYQASPRHLMAAGSQVWLDDKLILEAKASVRGVVNYRQMLVAADTDHLYLMSQEGELLETQDITTGLPGQILAIGQNGQLWLETRDGTFISDEDLIEWSQAMPLAPIPWAKGVVDGDTQTIIHDVRASRLNWERVLLDLHSGRFFGALGPYLMDLVALGLIIMSLTGVYIWLQQKPYKPRKRK